MATFDSFPGWAIKTNQSNIESAEFKIFSKENNIKLLPSLFLLMPTDSNYDIYIGKHPSSNVLS